jgi:outer membrane protein TolC
MQHRYSKKDQFFYKLTVGMLFFPAFLFAQQPAKDSLLKEATLPNVIAYAISHQPVVQQSLIDEKITESNIKSKLADWYPQVHFNYNLQRNFQVPTSIIGGNPIRLGVSNTSNLQFTATQNIFNRDAVLALHSKDDVRTQSRQSTSATKIEVAATVAKAFYDAISTEQQIKLAEENIVRLQKSLDNAYQQYKAGLVDKTDYKRATITLNNTKAQKQNNEALLKAKLENLKSLIGYPISASLDIVYDSLQMENEIFLDTLQVADASKRIEYQLLQTQKKLQQAYVKYNKWAYLPDVSANGAYNANYLSNQFGKLYSSNYPSSYASITLSFPIFQGGKRKYDTQAAEWEVKRTDWSIADLQNKVNAQYANALAGYKSNLISYLAQKENVNLAKEVYDVINLQYQSGVKTYIEVIVAETELRASQILYYNNLYQVLSSKIDVQQALGQIVY